VFLAESVIKLAQILYTFRFIIGMYGWIHEETFNKLTLHKRLFMVEKVFFAIR